MSQQNVYDDPIFFAGYQNMRNNEGNANILIEKPALFSLMPYIKNKALLDLGCGYGENCIEFVSLGARRVVGIDISKKMLDIAELEYSHPKIEYKNVSMENISSINERFDVVVSSLAIHYVEKFETLVKDIHKLLKRNGYFLFSQENPINTCFTKGNRWTTDENGHVLYANLSNYSIDGKRESQWFVENVIKYHRTFSSIINSLIEAGFMIESLLEPIPEKEIMEKHPEYQKDFHKPDFLLVRVRK